MNPTLFYTFLEFIQYVESRRLNAVVWFSYGNAYEVSAGTTYVRNVFSVPKGKKLHLKWVIIWFPSGTDYKLQLTILRGSSQVVPTEGVISGEDNVLYIPCDIEYESGEYVKIKEIGTQVAQNYPYSILFLGELK